MSFNLKKAKDQKAIDALLDEVMDALKSGDANKAQVRYLVGHLLILSANGEEKAVREWLKAGRAKRWRADCKKVRGF